MQQPPDRHGNSQPELFPEPAESVEAPQTQPRETDTIADGREHRLDPRTVILERIGRAIFAVVAAGGGFIALVVVLYRTTPGFLGGGAMLAVWAAFGALLAALAWFWPPVRYRHQSWLLDGQGLTIRSGVIWKSTISVPRSRVQHTDVSQGPIERSLELATLIIHTAGTQHASVSLGGLQHEVALRLRDHLIDVDDRDAV